jgi:hypothetical protein
LLQQPLPSDGWSSRPRPPPLRRAVVRGHKLALQAQRHFWGALLHETIHHANIATAMSAMQRAEAQAEQVGAWGLPAVSTPDACTAARGRLAADCACSSPPPCTPATACHPTHTTAPAPLQVYRRVMSRYPQNGRLLLLFGRFLEDAQHNPWAAAKYYRCAPELRRPGRLPGAQQAASASASASGSIWQCQGCGLCSICWRGRGDSGGAHPPNHA